MSASLPLPGTAAAVPAAPESAGPVDAAAGQAPVARGWLISRSADFWLATGGASLALLVILAVLTWRGDRELDWVDFIFAELHVGATYDAIVRRRLWRRMPWDVVVVPLVILAATFFLMLSGRQIWIFTVLMYLAVWHRGRQNFGVARYYQRQMGGPVSSLHRWLFLGAIYLPMAASVLFYTRAYPEKYEGARYHALVLPRVVTLGLGVVAALWVLAYLAFTVGKIGDPAAAAEPPPPGAPLPAGTFTATHVHPAERWIVLAHVVAFGSAYLLGGWKASYIIVLAVHHEVQYLYFAYAIARRDPAKRPETWRRELALLGVFSILPIIGLLSAIGTNLSGWAWLAPSGVGLLLCHYWLDGRIWKGAAMRPA